jgi:pilus assembly protein FimV
VTLKLCAKNAVFAVLSAALFGGAPTLVAGEAATPVDQAERKRIVEQFRAGLKASPARQKLDSVMTPVDPGAGAAADASGAPGAALPPAVRRLQLVALTASNEVEMGELRARLQLAESERLPADFVFALLGVLAACLGALVYLWRGRRRAMSTVRFIPAHDAGSGDARHPPAALQGLAAAPRPTAIDPFEGEPSLAPASVGDSLVEMGEVEFDKLMASGRTDSAFRKGALPNGRDASAGGGASNLRERREAVRAVSSEAQFDIRQQAGFFLSLGRTEQALRILERHILENGESSPVIYLDLLDILHGKGLKTQFRKAREEFNLLFNGKVPEFPLFHDGGRDLEGYPHVLAHIMALWPTSKVLMVIEASIYRDPWNDASAPFELPAFRDLVLLHALALGNADQEGNADRLVPGALVLDLDLTQADAKTEHTRARPSWDVEFQNTKPGLATGVDCNLEIPPKANMKANNLIDFELPGESRSPA